ncbi:MAG: hypothetical protein NWF09_03545, partial [Candidatus Bathyarchaeota archaeon]|nr:hypothetical protein [Candidatus Bathyarchaeota archaeon]
VAAWMGALTTGFMATEELKITNADFTQDDVTLYVKNTGTASVTIEAAYINGQPANQITIAVGAQQGTYTIPANTNATVTLTYNENFQDGSRYEFRLMTSKGNAFVYTATAPTSTSSGGD